jgi:nucleotide-binding universal stress UspA family protein
MTPELSNGERAPERIVVGVDGSESAQRALRWAINEARRREAALEVVHAWRRIPISDYIVNEPEPGGSARFARAVLDQAVDAEDTTGIAVERKLVPGAGASALIHEAKGAALLVVGSRGRGGFGGLLLGSVSQQAAHHAPCPVVIIPHDV